MSPVLIAVLIIDLISVTTFVVSLFLYRSLCVNRQILLTDLRASKDLRKPRLFDGPVRMYGFFTVILLGLSFVPFIHIFLQ